MTKFRQFEMPIVLGNKAESTEARPVIDYLSVVMRFFECSAEEIEIQKKMILDDPSIGEWFKAQAIKYADRAKKTHRES